MEVLAIRGGKRLEGSIRVGGAKNAALPIMAAAIMTDEPIHLADLPEISDIAAMEQILHTLGCQTSRIGDEMTLAPQSMTGCCLPEHLSKKIRSSIFLLGPVLARFRRAQVTYPGGCEIGQRPIDLHLEGLRRLGAEIREEGGQIFCRGENMHAGHVHFDYPSVGATENVMMAAAMLPGDTVISNAAREPEVCDLERFLCRMGARITGAGTGMITISGVRHLHGISYRPMADRIVTGTLLAACAATGGSITVNNAPTCHMAAILEKLTAMGCCITSGKDTISLQAPERLHAFGHLQTQPHPGFPTDMQVQMLALACRADGSSMIEENVFENRFAHAAELRRMGAKILVNGRTAVVQGVERLTGARVFARDLRGGAALAIAGLCAEGDTVIENATLIDRGYERLENMLAKLGAQAVRRNEEDTDAGQRK